MGHMILFAVLLGVAAFLAGLCMGLVTDTAEKKTVTKRRRQRNDTEYERQNRLHRNFLYYNGEENFDFERKN